MAENESGSLVASSAAHLLEPIPLRKGQRVAATSVGAAFAGAGIASVFLGQNQAGSVALLVVAAVFLLIAVSGMPILGAKVKDFEVHLAGRWRQVAWEVADRLPDREGRRLLQLIESRDPGAYAEPLVTLIDSLLFEGRVRDAVVCAAREGERVEPHPEADVGEPLMLWISAGGDVRIGFFAMFAPSETGKIPPAHYDWFVRRLPRSGCDAHLMITCRPDDGDLAALVARLRQDLGLPVAVERWAPTGDGKPLRPAIDGLVAAVRGMRTEVPD